MHLVTHLYLNYTYSTSIYPTITIYYVCTSFWNYSSMPTYEVYVPIWVRANIDAHMPTLATCWHTMKPPSDSHQNIPPCSTPNVPPVPQIGTIPAALHVELCSFFYTMWPAVASLKKRSKSPQFVSKSLVALRPKMWPPSLMGTS